MQWRKRRISSPDDETDTDPDQPGTSMQSAQSAARRKDRAERMGRAKKGREWEPQTYEELEQRNLDARRSALTRHRNRLYGDPDRYVQGWRPSDHYLIKRKGRLRSDIGLEEMTFVIQPQNLRIQSRTYDEIRAKLGGVLESALQSVIEGSDPDSYGRLVILHDQLNYGGGAISTRITRLWDLNIFELLEKLAAAMNSDAKIKLEECTFHLLIAPPPRDEQARRESLMQSQWARTVSRVQGRRRQPGRERDGWKMPTYGARNRGAARRREADMEKWLQTRRSVHDPSRFIKSKACIQTFLLRSCTDRRTLDSRPREPNSKGVDSMVYGTRSAATGRGPGSTPDRGSGSASRTIYPRASACNGDDHPREKRRSSSEYIYMPCTPDSRNRPPQCPETNRHITSK